MFVSKVDIDALFLLGGIKHQKYFFSTDFLIFQKDLNSTTNYVNQKAQL